MKQNLALLALAAGAGALIARNNLWIGLREFSAPGLARQRDRGEKITMLVIGLAVFDQDVTPDLARETIGRLVVLGNLSAGAALRGALEGRCTVFSLNELAALARQV